MQSAYLSTTSVIPGTIPELFRAFFHGNIPRSYNEKLKSADDPTYNNTKIYSYNRAKMLVELIKNLGTENDDSYKKFVEGYQYTFLDIQNVGEISIYRIISPDALPEKEFPGETRKLLAINNEIFNRFFGGFSIKFTFQKTIGSYTYITAGEYETKINELLSRIAISQESPILAENVQSYVEFFAGHFIMYIIDRINERNEEISSFLVNLQADIIRLEKEEKTEAKKSETQEKIDETVVLNNELENNILQAKALSIIYPLYRMLTEQDIEKLLELRYNKKIKRILDSIDNVDLLTHILTLLVDLGVSETIAYLQTCRNSQEVIMESEMMQDARHEYYFNLERLRFKPILEAGSVQCRRCNSRDVVIVPVQTRSADEPMTNMAKCHGCGNQWRG